ncbi:hypothetical protein [Actinocatenispora rupis]|uniref:Uncharacterized protein n=1 Tax=Actinocatenispora rupis TaxID=519421 RepID=A0A8J3J714_9ACTN|nr:hypothetical protein [Actinocatenispora rupis]GID16065.1 hypothetical protein Aru02nite_69540 [Actinocatenispora rupis]
MATELPAGVTIDEDDILYAGGMPIGRVVPTGPVWMALALTRAYGSMDEVGKRLPSRAAAIGVVLDRSRRHWE